MKFYSANTHFLCSSILLILFLSSGCKKLHILDPTGTSSMIVTVNGVRDTVSDVGSTNYLGTLEIRGTTKKYKISMDLRSWSLGDHNWKEADAHIATFNPNDSASIIGHIPIPDVGGYCILSTDVSDRVVEGTFSFTGLNSYVHDTVYVSDGKFTLYYREEGY